MDYFLHTTQFIIFIIVAATTIVLALYYLTLFKVNATKPIKTNFKEGISVIIAAKNEQENLTQNLPHLLNQVYLNFEIIVVNDGSFDGTKKLLDDMALVYKNLKVVHLELEERYQKGKKFALTMGIKAAKNEHLLFTDADCKPNSNLWIQNMANFYTKNDIILGIAPLNTKSSLLGSVISYETFHTAIQYLGYSSRDKTYMGVGRNLGYTKTLFFESKGFASHQHIMSGDDDLFIQEAAKNKKVGICFAQDSFMYSDSPTSFSKWVKQKVRHLSTSKEYKFIYKLLLGLYSVAQIFWLISTISFLLLYPKY